MRICPHCKRKFREHYICERWSIGRGVPKFIGARGYALANYERHVFACKKKVKRVSDADE